MFLLLVTILLLPTYLVRLSLFGVPTNLLELLALATIVATFWNVRKWKEHFITLPRIYLISAGLIVLGVSLSALASVDWHVSLGIIKGWFLIPIAFSLAVYAQLKQNQLTIRHILAAYYSSAVATSFIALDYALSRTYTYDGRLSAFYESPNQLAMFLAPAIFVGAYLGLTKWRHVLVKNWTNSICLAGLAFAYISLWLTVFLTSSYATWAAIAISLLGLALLARQWKIIIVLTALACAIVISQLGTPKMSDLLGRTAHSSWDSRLAIWKASIRIGSDHPIWGIGPGNFQKKYLDYQVYFPPYPEWAVPQPHNLYLAFWLQTGLIGTLGFLMLTISFLYQLFRRIQKQKGDHPLVALTILGIILFVLIHGLVDTPYWRNDLAFLFWILIVVGLTATDNTD
ncbi:O-antigen ligase family protein [Patescibacteria group bacterium]|nr:MAG: O-antigen ligase family protein [Patescibacteria group bacterium]